MFSTSLYQHQSIVSLILHSIVMLEESNDVHGDGTISYIGPTTQLSLHRFSALTGVTHSPMLFDVLESLNRVVVSCCIRFEQALGTLPQVVLGTDVMTSFG